MLFNMSDFLSIVALVVSIASARYTKKQSELAKLSTHNDHLAYLATQHEKYRVELKQVSSKHKEEINQLSYEAGRALTSIVHLFDQYDTGKSEIRYLRHLAHECSEMVYCAFKGQLGWQSGLNISHRFYRTSFIEDHLKPQRNLFSQDEFIESLRNHYLENPNLYQEQELMSDKYFCGLIKQIKGRIDSAKTSEFLLAVQAELEPFRVHFEELQPKFCESASHLDEVLEECDLEHFPLSDSPKLNARLKYKKATLETLGNLIITKIDQDHADDYYNVVSMTIYTCGILHAIQDFHSWGWEQP